MLSVKSISNRLSPSSEVLFILILEKKVDAVLESLFARIGRECQGWMMRV
ncbi:hypothetical protein PPL19_12228 [Pseudomonas psychrotolerans L19]|nr:hypothetical protein PPL19_12228 [Pseudomonas psychrotolerans L19]